MTTKAMDSKNYYECHITLEPISATMDAIHATS